MDQSKTNQVEEKKGGYREVRYNEILAVINEITGITPQQVKSPLRLQDVTDARRAFVHLVNIERGRSFSPTEIGHFLFRNHATIIHLLRRSNDLMITDRQYKTMVEVVGQRLNINKSSPMSKADKSDAILFINVRLEELNKWLKEHPENSYRERILKDVRELEQERHKLETSPTELGNQNKTNIS